MHEEHRCWCQRCPCKLFHNPVKGNRPNTRGCNEILSNIQLQTQDGGVPSQSGPWWWRRRQIETWEAAESFRTSCLLWTPTPSQWPKGGSITISDSYSNKKSFISTCSTSSDPGSRNRPKVRLTCLSVFRLQIVCIKQCHLSFSQPVCVSEDKGEMLLFLPHRQTRDGNVEPLGLLDTSQPPLRLQTARTPSVASSSDRTQAVMSQSGTDKPNHSKKSYIGLKAH